jgi:hypothetical protein
MKFILWENQFFDALVSLEFREALPYIRGLCKEWSRKENLAEELPCAFDEMLEFLCRLGTDSDAVTKEA